MQNEVSAGGTQPSFILACCMAHARRKLVEAEPDYPQVREVLDLIGELYKIEARAKLAPEHERLAVLAQLRNTESRPLMDKIKKWLLSQVALPRSSLGKAIGYAVEFWSGLELFLDHPEVAIDNNHVEREMRCVASLVSLCATSLSTWNRESSVIARISTRTAPSRAAA